MDIMINVLKHFDVIIVGAGPAGTSCALSLKNSNLSVLLIDKDSFPRDKVCGDVVGGRSIKNLNKYFPELIEELKSFEMKEFISTTRIFIDNKKPFNINWKNESYCIKRRDFDMILLKHAIKNCRDLIFEANFKVDAVIKEDDKVLIGNKRTNTYYSANIVVAADGSQSFLAKQLINLKFDPSNFSAAVRAYYSNVDGILPNQTEVHIYKKYMPGYLWIFPLGNNTANVGFGMLSNEISKRKINLKLSLTQIISEHPQLAKRFINAKIESEVQGFGLAIGSRKVKLYGNNFLLIGDAASLIDPKSGDGISNAIESGIISASTIDNAHKINDFSKESLKKYKIDLNKTIGDELLMSTIMLRLGTYLPFVIKIIPTLMKNKLLLNLVRRLL
jgi:geranylgeranyl reductase family protein